MIYREILKALTVAALLFTGVIVSYGQEETPQLAQIRINTDPAGASVQLDSGKAMPSPALFKDVKAGSHSITIKKKGYKTLRQTLTTELGERTIHKYKLTPVKGLVLLHSTPDGAEIVIDGLNKGKTPLLLTDLPVGSYKVKFSLPGYVSKTVSLSIEDRTPFKLEETLLSDSASLTVKSVPTGAKVSVNGILKGSTPCTVDRIPGGSSTVQVSAEGYKPFSETIRLAAGQTEVLTAHLEAIPSNLKIVSIPKGARIYINNQFKGEAPVSLKDLPAGSYRVRADLKGFDSSARTVELGRADDRTEEFRMLGICGSLQVTTQPAGVSVFIDDEFKGKTTSKEGETDMVSSPLTIEMVPEGTRIVKLVHKKYFPAAYKVKIEKDKTFTLQKKMKRRFIPDYEVRTSTEVFTGVLIDINPKGDVRLELKPGIIRTIPAADVRSRKPIKKEKLETVE